jgi:hypothetical protein
MNMSPVFGVLALFGMAYVALCFLIGWAADQRRQSGLLWFLLALFTSPIVAGLLLLIIASPRRFD